MYSMFDLHKCITLTEIPVLQSQVGQVSNLNPGWEESHRARSDHTFRTKPLMEIWPALLYGVKDVCSKTSKLQLSIVPLKTMMKRVSLVCTYIHVGYINALYLLLYLPDQFLWQQFQAYLESGSPGQFHHKHTAVSTFVHVNTSVFIAYINSLIKGQYSFISL